MVIEGWQLADRLQTLFFDIKRFGSESHFHAFSLSRSLAHAQKKINKKTRAPDTHACTRKHNTAHFPLIWLPKLKDFEGLTQPGEHVRTSVYSPALGKSAQFHQPLSERAPWDAQTRFLCDLKMIPNISFSLLRLGWSAAIFLDKHVTQVPTIARRERCVQSSGAAFPNGSTGRTLHDAVKLKLHTVEGGGGVTWSGRDRASVSEIAECTQQTSMGNETAFPQNKKEICQQALRSGFFLVDGNGYKVEEDWWMGTRIFWHSSWIFMGSSSDRQQWEHYIRIDVGICDPFPVMTDDVIVALPWFAVLAKSCLCLGSSGAQTLLNLHYTLSGYTLKKMSEH